MEHCSRDDDKGRPRLGEVLEEVGLLNKDVGMEWYVSAFGTFVHDRFSWLLRTLNNEG